MARNFDVYRGEERARKCGPLCIARDRRIGAGAAADYALDAREQLQGGGVLFVQPPARLALEIHASNCS
jgi:hypothetical protein